MARFQCIAHRGAKGYEPENTLLAIKKALELQSPWIEVDVHCIAGNLLVTHDTEVVSADGTTVDIRQGDLDFIRSIDVGKGQCIPTLQEVIEEVGRQAKLNIEIKGPNTAQTTCSLLMSYLEAGSRQLEDFMISSFRHDELFTARRLLPEIPLGVLLESPRVPWHDLASRLGARYLNVSAEMVSPELVVEAKARGLKVLVFTVNSLAEMEKLYRFGVSGIFSDYPDVRFRLQETGD